MVREVAVAVAGAVRRELWNELPAGFDGLLALPRPLVHGDVRAQNVLPTLEWDLLSITDKIGGAFTPVGFYYRTMIRPRWAWPLYERFLRNVAGLGRVNKHARRFYDEGEDFWPKRYAIWGRLIASEPNQIAYSIIDAKSMHMFMPSIFPAIAAPTIAELKQNPDLLRPREVLLLRNTRPVNVWGLPAISVPCGFTQSGLPIGLQIAGPPWREDIVLQLAYAYEQATAWHKRECDVPSIRRG